MTVTAEWLAASCAVSLAVTLTMFGCNEKHAPERAQQAEQAQPPGVAQQQSSQQATVQTARQYFTEMYDSNVFNKYADKYVCFRDDNDPSFAVVSTIEDIVDAATRNHDEEDAKKIAKLGDGLFVQTYFQGVASDSGLDYDKKNGEYRYDFEMSSHHHGRTVYRINWKTGRYRFQVYALDYNKTLPAYEVSGKCQLIHPGDKPSVVGDR
jgi:hypothetical protein